jgi:hypothetical protein
VFASRYTIALALLIALQLLMIIASAVRPMAASWQVAGRAPDGSPYLGYRVVILDGGRLLFMLKGSGRPDADTDVTRWNFHSRSTAADGPFDAPAVMRTIGIDWQWRAWKDASGMTTYRQCAIEIPSWLPVLMTLVAAYLLQLRGALARRRLRAGLCAACGYDVRATPERCPECGLTRG